MDFYQVTVPPLKRLTAAVPRLIDKLYSAAPLTARLAPDGFTAGEHLCVALGYVARTVLPLVGRDTPDLPCDPDPGVVTALAQDMRYLLDNLAPTDFDDTAARTIIHIAGEAKLRQSAQDYATLYALPNAHFHLTLGYATLRMAGADVGKGDLDGYHRYAPGTNFAAPMH